MNVDLPRPSKGQLVLLWAAGLAAITLTASGEYALYVACGFGAGWSAAGPVCIDAYVMAAIHARREVPFAVLVMTATNATAHLLPEAGPPVAVKVAVAALAPVVLWRVHALAGHRGPVPVVDAEPVPDADDGSVPVWAAPWDAEPWPLDRAPFVELDRVPAANVTTWSAAPVATAPVAEAPVEDVREDHRHDRLADLVDVRGPVTGLVTAPVAEVAVADPRGDQPDDRGGNHGIDREPVIPLVTEVVTSPAEDGAAAGSQDDHGGDHPHAGTVATLDEAAIDVRRAARELNNKVVQATGRAVTVATLQAEYGLSRRVATELRRYLVAAG